MKEIKAIIQPFMLSKVINALKESESFPGVTVDMSVCGFGRGRAAEAKAMVIEDAVEYVKKVRLEIVVPDHLAEKVVQIIQTNAHTGSPGDGKIFVSTVDNVIRVSTGERGEVAI